MRTFLVFVAIGLSGLVLLGWWKYDSQFPKPSQETVLLDAGKRATLERLRKEHKFEPYDYPPLGYTGIATPEDGVAARLAVNNVIDAILAQKDGPISATKVSALIGQAMDRVSMLETEDRDRTSDYMVEIWYLLGFKGATGQFAYGASFKLPEGYGEPLPPGWKSPREPRPIG